MPESIQNKPAFHPNAVAEALEQHYGRQSQLEPLPSERDQNFKLTESDGTTSVFKIANQDTPPEALDLQIALTDHLAKEIENAQFPTNHPSLSGQTTLNLTDSTGQLFQARLVSYLEGTVWSDFRPKTHSLQEQLGNHVGTVTRALAHFEHPGAHRDLQWDLQRAPEVVAESVSHVRDPELREAIDQTLTDYQSHARTEHQNARRSVIHGDVNDHNIIVQPRNGQPTLSLIDYGDAVHCATVNELAITLAYALFETPDPFSAAAAVVRGFHQQFPLEESEIRLLEILIRLRLCTSITQAARTQEYHANEPYLTVSVGPAGTLLHWLSDQPPQLFHYTVREACGLPPVPQSVSVRHWLRQEASPRPIVDHLDQQNAAVLDLSVGSPLSMTVDSPPEINQAIQNIADTLFAAQKPIGIGRYAEPRFCYQAPHYQTAEGGHRTVHLGVDLFLEPGCEIKAPLAGRIHSFQDNHGPQDYGPTLIIEHHPESLEAPFYSLYGHLSRGALNGLAVGQTIAAGQVIGTVGYPEENGGWPPHIHVQLILDPLGYVGDFPGVATPKHRAVWQSISPSPAAFLGIDSPGFPVEAEETNQSPALQARRQAALSPSLSLSYQEPLHIVRGRGQYLYDPLGRAYLDCVNNVCHVGHSHPHVVSAIRQQAAVLNTNTRYLHEQLVDYAERLCALLPSPLEVCFLVCSGSEANDLALRLARHATGSRETFVLEGAYHGNLTSTVEISPYKFDGPGGFTPPAYVHTLPVPDRFRGQFQDPSPDLSERYIATLTESLKGLPGAQRPTFIAESVLSCAGQIVLPNGYLKGCYEQIHARGGLCIADEVQVGFGRVGTHFWGFETQGVVPDIVTLGKPIGNGHPIGAVVTTRAIADAFANGMEYFNTFGGNPVSCAAANAVLDVIQADNLQRHAALVGNQLLAKLQALAADYPRIGDVRGLGLFLGIELVKNSHREPDPELARYLVERSKSERILLSVDGPDHNVIKIKPPMAFDSGDADRLVQTLERTLNDTVVKQGNRP